MEKNIKSRVKKYYGDIAKGVKKNSNNSCNAGTACCNTESGIYSLDYIKDLPKEAVEASLGCANPISLANLRKGEIVLDLGSGGGIDVFISSKFVGETGKVYGLDMTDEMLELANMNKEKSGIKNVEFLKGYIEDIPLDDESIDVITSNCVINLSENKRDSLKEAYRVLKKGGRLAIADIVQLKSVSDEIKNNVLMWMGCIAGALTIEEYREFLEDAGFSDIEITPVNIFTEKVIKSIVGNKKIIEDELDGAFASVHIKAYKYKS